MRPMLSLWLEAWRVLCLACWKWARHDLTITKGPNHPDMPKIVRAIARLERRP